MSDLISREALKSEAFSVFTKEYGQIDVVGVDAIDSSPTTDAVQVVRCKDCTNRNTCVCPLEYAIRWGIGNDELHDDDFCSYGERMDADAPERAGKDGRDGKAD